MVIGVEGTNASIRAKKLSSPPRNLFHFWEESYLFLRFSKEGSTHSEGWIKGRGGGEEKGNGLWRSLMGCSVMITFPLKVKNMMIRKRTWRRIHL